MKESNVGPQPTASTESVRSVSQSSAGSRQVLWACVSQVNFIQSLYNIQKLNNNHNKHDLLLLYFQKICVYKVEPIISFYAIVENLWVKQNLSQKGIVINIHNKHR